VSTRNGFDHDWCENMTEMCVHMFIILEIITPMILPKSCECCSLIASLLRLFFPIIIKVFWKKKFIQRKKCLN